jgi:hypothetical protein
MGPSTTKLSRRTLFAGASTVGAIAAATSFLPSIRGTSGPPEPIAKPAPEKGGGYSLSAHVQKYYKTTRV